MNNTLAYSDTESITAVKCFEVQFPGSNATTYIEDKVQLQNFFTPLLRPAGANVIKPFLSVICELS